MELRSLNEYIEPANTLLITGHRGSLAQVVTANDQGEPESSRQGVGFELMGVTTKGDEVSTPFFTVDSPTELVCFMRCLAILGALAFGLDFRKEWESLIEESKTGSTSSNPDPPTGFFL